MEGQGLSKEDVGTREDDGKKPSRKGKGRNNRGRKANGRRRAGRRPLKGKMRFIEDYMSREISFLKHWIKVFISFMAQTITNENALLRTRV